jgi:uncharacterized protein (DUF1501 family)
MQRRDFLRWCGSAGLGLAVPVGLRAAPASAEPPPYDGPYYIVFNAFGGWDTTYLMDPKGVDGINRLFQQGDILTQGQHKFAPTDKHKQGGMSNETFFEKYGQELLVVNGLDYSLNNHDSGARYVATGKLESLVYPTFAALVAACKGLQYPLGFLTFGNYSVTGNLVPMAKVPYLQSLGLLSSADSVNYESAATYHEKEVLDRIERALRDQAEARAAQPRLPRTERSQSMLYAAQLSSKMLARVTPYFPKTPSTSPLGRQIDVALAAFKAGLCVSANLDISTFDSHRNNDADQMRLIPELLAGIDEVARRAEELKIRDQLVIVVQSEMGRTPTYNENNGKDHWSIGSIMFLGRGIKGNRVVGASDEKQFAVPIDPQTLATDPAKGIKLRPEHIHLALRKLAGIEEHAFSKQVPLELPEPQRLRGLFG